MKKISKARFYFNLISLLFMFGLEQYFITFLSLHIGRQNSSDAG